MTKKTPKTPETKAYRHDFANKLVEARRKGNSDIAKNLLYDAMNTQDYWTNKFGEHEEMANIRYERHKVSTNMKKEKLNEIEENKDQKQKNMKEFNPEKYRDGLVKKLKNLEKGSILDKTKELFLSDENKNKLIKKRHEKAQEFLSKERFSNEYQEAKDIIHPEILEKIRKERKEWNDKASDIMKNERINNIEDFKKKYPDFESFLKNKDFVFLVENGSKKVLIKKNSEEYEKLLAMEPYSNTYGFQYAYIGGNSADAKIITESETHDVLPKCYSEEDMGDGTKDTNESEGEKIGDTLKKVEPFEKIAIVTSYNGRFDFTYGGDDICKITPFLEKLDPEFFKGGGKNVGAIRGNGNDIGFFENVNGQKKAITPGDFGPFIKEDTILYLCKE